MKAPTDYIAHRLEAGDWRFFAKLAFGFCMASGSWSLATGVMRASEGGSQAWFALFSGVMSGFSFGNILALGVIWLFNTMRERDKARQKAGL